MIRPLLISASLILCSCSSTAPAPQQPEYPGITLTSSDGTPLTIEDDGSPQRHQLYVLAGELQQMDARIQQWQQSHDDSEVANRMLEVMQQNRADAARQLEDAWAASSSRSWTSVSENAAAADNNIQSVKSAMTGTLPGSLYCSTNITSASADSYLHYLPEGVYRDGGEDWISYTPGSKIKIGNYRFKVSGGQQEYNEKVTIMQDPFVHLLQPK